MSGDAPGSPWVPLGATDGGWQHSVDLVKVTTSSPRWLQITRDVLISLVAVLFIVGAVLTAVALNQAGNALSDIGTPDPSPTACLIDPNDPTCIPGD